MRCMIYDIAMQILRHTTDVHFFLFFAVVVLYFYGMSLFLIRVLLMYANCFMFYVLCMNHVIQISPCEIIKFSCILYLVSCIYCVRVDKNFAAENARAFKIGQLITASQNVNCIASFYILLFSNHGDFLCG